MAPANLSHRQTHNLLLISKLLSLRDTASPLTLLLDSLEQPATPLVKEYIRRAKVCAVDAFLILYYLDLCIGPGLSCVYSICWTQGVGYAIRPLMGRDEYLYHRQDKAKSSYRSPKFMSHLLLLRH